MTSTILLARGTTPGERERSIDTIRSWAREHNAGIHPDTITDLYEWTESNATTATANRDDEYLFIVPGDETARDRQGPDDPAAAAINKASSAAAANLIVDSLAGINIDAVARIVTQDRVRVHDATHALTVHPVTRDRDDLPPSTRRALEVLAGTADHADALLAGISWNGGRPPLGCTSDGARLAPADNYDDVCRVLQRVRDDELSQTEASNRLGCARKTVGNALDRPELYRLD
ncbi:hypothetical protein [Natrinema salinisoli]|uniref:hypothetical protein n=1 Tax=Natrinema salinisoli TaxID=2878535 RepID=UPI001CF06EC2|nr:hypothetical protein [Natrinema salinisoli]